jgi:hypothetical protein
MPRPPLSTQRVRAGAKASETRRSADAAQERVDETLRALHAALLALPVPDRLRRTIDAPDRTAPGSHARGLRAPDAHAPGSRPRDTEDR